MNKLTEEVIDFKTFEKIVFSIMCKVACELIQLSLWTWDRIVMARRDRNEYYCIGSRKSTIKTIMGEVEYKRRYYRKHSGGYVFLLDEMIGLQKDYGLVSENFAEHIVAECSEKSFRKAANSISSLTGQAISAMGAWGVVKRFGEKLESQEDLLEELDRKGVVGQLGNLFCKVLFGEFDDVWLSRQKEKRRKKGESSDDGQKKPGMKPMHVGTAYTGWEQEKDGSYKSVDKFAYASYGDTTGFVSKYEMLLRQRFDMDGVEQRLINGDGESWIKTAAEGCDAILQLDPYHRSQAVIKAIRDRNDRKAVFDAIKESDVDKVLGTISAIADKTNDEDLRKTVLELYTYFFNNRDSLLTWKERGIELPSPPEGQDYRTLGIQETSNCELITSRMKGNKASWSVDGANTMGKILCYRGTIGIDTVLGILQEPPLAQSLEDPLSAARAPLYDGKGYEGRHADMPFEQAFKTNGREAIRNIFRQKPLADLRFI